MSLKRAALLAATGLLLSFGIRTVATLAPELLWERSAAGLAAAALLLGGLGVVVFLVVFRHQGVRPGERQLQHATYLAICGAIVGLLPEVQGLIRVLELAPGTGLLQNDHVSALAPWVAGLTIFVFFMALFRQARRRGRRDQTRVAASGVVGSAALLLVVSAAVLLFTLTAIGAHSPVLPQVLWAAAPLGTIGFAALLYFFLAVWLRPELAA